MPMLEGDWSFLSGWVGLAPKLEPLWGGAYCCCGAGGEEVSGHPSTMGVGTMGWPDGVGTGWWHQPCLEVQVVGTRVAVMALWSQDPCPLRHNVVTEGTQEVALVALGVRRLIFQGKKGDDEDAAGLWWRLGVRSLIP